MTGRPYRVLRVFGRRVRFALLVPILLCAAYAAQSEVGPDRELHSVDVRAVLYSMTDRVADYADWHFGWVTNYSSAYSIAYRVLHQKMRSFLGGEPDITIFETAERYYSEALNKRVILPEQFSGQMQKLAFEYLAMRLADDDRSAVDATCAGQLTDVACQDDLVAYTQIREKFLNAAFLASIANQTFRPERCLKLDDSLIFNIQRAYRPLLIRSGFFIVRFTEFTTILVFVVGLVRGFIGIPNNFFLVSAISLLAIYSVDYAISRVDAALNQKNFESVLTVEILRQEADLVGFIDEWTENQIRRYSDFRQNELAIIRQDR